MSVLFKSVFIYLPLDESFFVRLYCDLAYYFLERLFTFRTNRDSQHDIQLYSLGRPWPCVARGVCGPRTYFRLFGHLDLSNLSFIRGGSRELSTTIYSQISDLHCYRAYRTRLRLHLSMILCPNPRGTRRREGIRDRLPGPDPPTN